MLLRDEGAETDDEVGVALEQLTVPRVQVVDLHVLAVGGEREQVLLAVAQLSVEYFAIVAD